MKYISMKMDPKGSSPPMSAIIQGLRYQWRSGMGEGILLTLHGLSGSPFQFRPITCEPLRRVRPARHVTGAVCSLACSSVRREQEVSCT